MKPANYRSLLTFENAKTIKGEKQAIYNVLFRNSIGDETSRTFMAVDAERAIEIGRLYSQQNPLVGVAVRCEYVREAK